MAAVIPLDEARRLDAELVRIGRGASAMRLLVGEALAALSAAGGHHELRFSSFEAYARDLLAKELKLRNSPADSCETMIPYEGLQVSN